MSGDGKDVANGPRLHPHLPPAFRGSLSTLVASDDDLSSAYNNPNGTPGPPGTCPPGTNGAGWDYFLNWGPNFDNLVGVFKDIAALPDSSDGGKKAAAPPPPPLPHHAHHLGLAAPGQPPPPPNHNEEYV
jgi:protocadherin Fat 4